jgi:nicotinamide riboside transporter PnuC
VIQSINGSKQNFLLDFWNNRLITECLFILEYAKLYAEAVLYVFYVFSGIYGWVKWKKQKTVEEVYQYKLSTHIKLIASGTVFSILLYLV